MTSRTPSLPVRRILRREVNFGCPICGIPYLTWHHFNPPWEVEHHERPEGIIALCHICHDQADGNAFTKEQLFNFKNNPCVKKSEISAKYPYLRRTTACLVGNCIGYNTKNILTIDGERVISFEKDEDGYDRLNLIIRDYIGNIILNMVNNDWIIYTKDLFDVECPARGKSLKIISKDKYTDFELRFDDLEEEKFRDILRNLDYDSDRIDDLIGIIKQDNPERIPLWTLKGKIAYSNMDLEITDNGIEFDIDAVISKCTLNHVCSIGGNSLLVLGTNMIGTNKRDPLSSLHMLQRRERLLSESLNECRSIGEQTDIVIKELECSHAKSSIYRKVGEFFLISDKNEALCENISKRKNIDLQIGTLSTQKRKVDQRIKRLKRVIDSNTIE